MEGGNVKLINIEEIMNMLDWHMSPEIQSKGIALAKNIESIIPFIQPITERYNKNVWENCAIIIASKSDEELTPHLAKLLDWLQDMNWPGALIILERLKLFSGENLIKPFIDRFTYAINLNNEEGLMWLDCLSEFLDNKDLKSKLPNSVIEDLQNHYKNWGFWYDD